MKSLTGWLLHPNVQYPRNAVVADVGCGTAYVSIVLGLNCIQSHHSVLQRRCNADTILTWIDCRIWLQEVAELLPPPAQLIGFDISAAMFPASTWRLPHVKLMLHDVFEPFPTEHHEKYDVVHARFLRCFVSDAEVEGVLKNFLNLLSK